MKKVQDKYVFEDSSFDAIPSSFMLSSISSPHRWNIDLASEEDGTIATLEEKNTGIKLSLRFESRLEALAFREEFEKKLSGSKTTTVRKYIAKVKENPKTAISILASIAILGAIAYRSRDYLKKGFDAIYEKTAFEKFRGF